MSGAGNYYFESQNLSITVDENGTVLSVANRSNQICMKYDGIRVDSDVEEWSSANSIPNQVLETENGISFHYCRENVQYRVKYCFIPEEPFFERTIEVIPKTTMTIYRVCVVTQYENPPSEMINYDTFRNGSTATFLRFRDFSVYFGFANPFFKTAYCEGANLIEVSFEPSIILQKDAVWQSDAFFFGSCQLSGIKVEQQIPQTSMHYNRANQTRYRNPCGHLSLDRNEIRGFKKYADYYLEPRTKDFKIIFYNFFSILPQIPSTDGDEQLYCHFIDNFVKMGGEIITFNPLARHKPPLPDENGYWELYPEGSRAERIVQYALDKGLKLGFYMGTAYDNSRYCNSPMNEFASTTEKPSWKKIGFGGELSRENCIASDDFAEWFYHVQKNTIEKYGITLWNWDPGPGNAFFCYSTEHGHIPGKGAYKGFRNAMEIVRRLRHDFPELYIQGFHGTKEYGLWGFQGFDQHEAYWEEHPYDNATIYPDISEDRLTASGIRFQSWWNQNFRFMPSLTNHSLCARMMQNCRSPRELCYLFDHLGYKYAILSAIAAGASITVPMIPYDLNDIYGDYLGFFRKWTLWAKEHFQYNFETYAFGNQVVCGTVDGYSKLSNQEGYIFLCNSAPIKSRIVFEIGEEIGIKEQGTYLLKEIYPKEGAYIFGRNIGKGVFSTGDYVSITVPEYQIVILELKRKDSHQQDPALYGINGSVEIIQDMVTVNGSHFEYGQRDDAVIICKHPEKIKKVLVNGVLLPFTVQENQIIVQVRYGEELLPRFLYDWSDINGTETLCPNRETINNGHLYHRFFCSERIRKLLQKAVPKNINTIEEVVPKMQRSLSRNNFAWARPYRLHLVLPFSDTSVIGNILVKLNGIELSVDCLKANHYKESRPIVYFADITDFVLWEETNLIEFMLERVPERHFMGAYLYYPNEEDTSIVVPDMEAEKLNGLVDYPLYDTKPLLPYQNRTIRIPAVDMAWIKEGYIEEMQDFTVCAYVNLPEDEIEGVYLSAQIAIDDTGETLKSDECMEYDPVKRLWKKTLHMGNRQYLIIDEEYIYIWAITKDQYMSKQYKIKVEWRLF